MYGKCNVLEQNKKGFLKIHVIIVVIDIKTKQILSLEISDERVYDGKMLKNFVNHVLDSSSSNNSESNTVKMKSVLADDAYESNSNFQCLIEKKIKQGIKLRKNYVLSPRNNRSRNKEVIW